MKRIVNYDELLDTIQTVMGDRFVTQTELAAGINVTQPYVNRLFKKHNAPSIEVVFKMLDFLDIKIGCATPQPL